MAKTKIKTQFECAECGAIYPQLLGRCTECGAWNSVMERRILPPVSTEGAYSSRAILAGASDASPIVPKRLEDITLTESQERFSTGSSELDRVLGGGLLPGAYILLGGDPGIGKSTLMLQMTDAVSAQGKSILYVAGEESPHQIKRRAERLNIKGEKLFIYPETNLNSIQQELLSSRSDVVIIDSIQSLYDPETTGMPGGQSQVKACAGSLMGLAKALDITIILVGHVTKDGVVSGPKLLEHTVDTVLYVEGEKFQNLRLIRAVKNRFGSTNEIALFEMQEVGLREVLNPSELFLSESGYDNTPGRVIAATVEGNRPLLVEIQSLVGLSTYPSPRRVANGCDVGRVHQIVAVLEKRLGLDFSRQDIYVNVVGGLSVNEPAADLAIALAIVSASHQIPVYNKTVIAGEIGLTGEVRPIRMPTERASEAEKLGFSQLILPKSQAVLDAEAGCTLRIIPVQSLMQALSAALDQSKAPSHDQTSAPVI